ncbi:MAG: WYL domain-containing protein [Clostridia bacterium]|nr:WYL domain-containing protein [Clostridia bacterium]
MERINQLQKESVAKGNSEDSLLAIYILRILKKYSSPKNPLSSQDVMDYLKKDYSIGNSDKADAQRKKIRRHLDTLCEFYWGRCIKKEEGKTRNGHKWFYDVSRDKFADTEIPVQETLTETEVEFLVDLISATKILNSQGTRGLIDKLLKKTSMSYEDRKRRLRTIQGEAWLKTPNEDLVEKKDLIEEYFDNSCLVFDYEDEQSITATPLGWSYDDGICFLNAKVGNKNRKFSLDKIRICDSDVDEYEEFDDFRRYDEGTDSDKTTLDSLFVNIPTIKSAIADKKCLHFLYRSYVVANDCVASTDEEKSVLPHSLVFNDGKYYLIGIDENAPGFNKIAYFRVDLMFELYCVEHKNKLSDWDKHVYAMIERARLVEKHPLMLSDKEISVTFKVAESGLNRVVDTFAVKPDKFAVTKETRIVKNSYSEGFREEQLVKVQVKTTREEAFRWALANADVVELVYPQDVRDRLGRISDPIHKTYSTTVEDLVRENIDFIRETGMFKITMNVTENTAFETFKELEKQGEIDIVDKIYIAKLEGETGDYFGNFVNAKVLNVLDSPNCTNIIWASKLPKVVSLAIHKTQISDASWLKVMDGLGFVEISNTPIRDLSALSEHKRIRYLEINNTMVSDISFIEGFEHLYTLEVVNCPIDDYTPLLKIPPLDALRIDEKAVEALGMENLVKHHPNANISVHQQGNNRK